jgi:hypothetical protein
MAQGFAGKLCDEFRHHWNDDAKTDDIDQKRDKNETDGGLAILQHVENIGWSG